MDRQEAPPLLSVFRLSPPGSGHGLSCDANGAFVGTIPLLTRSNACGSDRWEPRDCGLLSKQIGKQFGLPIDMFSKAGGLRAISNALNEGDVARAQIAAVLLGIPDPPPPVKAARSRDAMIKFIRDLHWSGLIKADWDPDQHPRRPAGAPDGQGGEFAPKGSDTDVHDVQNTNLADPVAPNSLPQATTLHSGLNDAVFRPGSDPVELEEVGDPKQLLLNQLQHRLQVLKEMEQWRKKGFFVTPNVTFIDPRTDTPIVSDYVVSIWVPDPDSFLLFPKPEPILIRDVKTGEGGRTPNQKQVYPYILAGGEVVPVGRNAFIAGFEVGEPTVIAEMYVEGDLPGDTVH